MKKLTAILLAMCLLLSVAPPARAVEVLNTTPDSQAASEIEGTADLETDAGSEGNADPAKPKAPEATAEAADWTIGMYICGSDLESQSGSASLDILEVMAGGVPDNVRVMAMTGGASAWYPENISDAISHLADCVEDPYLGEYYKAVLDAAEVYANCIGSVDMKKVQLFEISTGNIKHIETLPGQDDGSLNMGDPETLKLLFQKIQEKSPAGHYMIELWNHGGGPNGGAEVDELHLTEDGYGDTLTMAEIKEAFNAIYEANSNNKLDLIGFDCCLMGSLEIASVLAPYADYMVASAEIEPAQGWYYKWINTVGTDYDGDGDTDAIDVGKAIVDYYALDLYDPNTALNMYDPNATPEVSEGEIMPKPLYQSGEEVKTENPDIWPEIIWSGNASETLALVDLNNMEPITTAFDALANVMNKIIEDAINEDEEASQLYSVISRSAENTVNMYYPELLDLYSFCVNISYYLEKMDADKQKSASADALRNAIDDLMDAIGNPYDEDEEVKTNQLGEVGDTLIYRGLGARFPDCAGLTFYYPVRNDMSGGELVWSAYAELGVSENYVNFLYNTLQKSGLVFGEMPEATLNEDETYSLTLSDEQNWAVKDVVFETTYVDESLEHWSLGMTTLKSPEQDEDGNYNYQVDPSDSLSWWTLAPTDQDGELTTEPQFVSANVVKSEFQDWLSVPAYVGDDDQLSMLNISRVKYLKLMGEEDSGFTEEELENNCWIYIDSVTPPSEDGMGSRSYEPSYPFTFTPVLEKLKPIDIDDPFSTPTELDGEVRGQTITVEANEDGTLRMDARQKKFDAGFNELYVGYFMVVDINGERHWTNGCPYATVPSYFSEEQAKEVSEANDEEYVPNSDSLEGLAKPIEDQVYTGQPVTPEVDFGLWSPVFLNIEGPDDYSVSYQNNTGPGTATVTVTALKDGFYGGFQDGDSPAPSFTLTFQIKPQSTSGGSTSDDSTSGSSSGGSSGGGGSSSGGSGSSTATSRVSVSSATGGKVTVSPSVPSTGKTVTLTVKPNNGYKLESITAKDSKNNVVELEKKSDTEYSFKMPSGKVTITPKFVKASSGDEASTGNEASTGTETSTGTEASTSTVNPFTDVESDAYYYEPVMWAVENAITTGTTETTFSPAKTCTRAEMVTFLWRAAGKPVPESTENPFTDVQSGAYYYDAVLWAVEKGITNGTNATTFSPNATVTRGQTVTLLYRSAGSPKTEATYPFTDVASGQYYTDAVLWAVENDITNGKSETSFGPDDGCTRAQIVTFLYRAQ